MKIFNSIKINETTQIYKTLNDIVIPKQLVKKEQFWSRILYLILNPFFIFTMVIVKFIYSYFKFKRVVLFGSFLVYDKYGNFINILWACDCELNLINQIIICHFEHSEGTQNSITIKAQIVDYVNSNTGK
jgi:hypothetical protein